MATCGVSTIKHQYALIKPRMRDVQVISQRYERGPTVFTTNRAFKQWPEIFNNDSSLTSALLDRLLHHAESVVIEGRGYRMCDQNDA